MIRNPSSSAHPSPSVIDVTAAPYNADPKGVVDCGKPVEEAITAAAVNGGVVYFPPGKYLTSKSWTLTDNTYIQGAGRNASTITWNTDLGGASPGILTGPNGTGNAYCAVRDLTLIGPGNRAAALGEAPCNMHGVVLRPKGQIERCNLFGWYGAVAIEGDHCRFREIKAAENYFGVFWKNGGTAFGNTGGYDSELVANKLAAFGIHGENSIDSSVFVNVHLGFCPFGIWKGHEGAYNKGLITNSYCQLWFESLGNGAIFDEKKEKNITANNFDILAMSFEESRKWAAAPANGKAEWAFFTKEMLENVMQCDANGVMPFSLGAFNVAQSYGNIILTGQSFLTGMAGGKVIFADAADVQGTYLYGAKAERYKFFKVGGATNPAIGDLLYMTAAEGWGVTKATAGIPAGFLGAWGLGATNHWAPLCVEGYFTGVTSKAELKENTLVKGAQAEIGKVEAITPGEAEKTAYPVVGYGTTSGGTKCNLHVTLGG